MKVVRAGQYAASDGLWSQGYANGIFGAIISQSVETSGGPRSTQLT